MSDRFTRRLAALTAAALVLILAWRWLPGPAPLPAPAPATGVVRQVEPPVPLAPVPAPLPITPAGDLAADERATVALFERSRGSVVFISTREQVRDIWSRNVMSVPRGTGSGFVWDAQGHVVTNLHVIQGASEASVRLADGREVRASLVGVSPSHDIAVLKVAFEDHRPSPLPLGRSAQLRVGQKVFAIGNPFGLDWTLTTGIVSALDRSLPSDAGATIDHLIQTDAAINPGNSGGPLLDSSGRLIGMNTAIYSPSGASAGIGFAVPVDTVNRVVPQLIRNGKYVSPSLGVEVDEAVNSRLQQLLHTDGVVLLGVERGSAAAQAGLQPAVVGRDGRVALGDVIVGIEGKPVGSVGELLGRLDDFRIGQTIALEVRREGRPRTVQVTLQGG